MKSLIMYDELKIMYKNNTYVDHIMDQLNKNCIPYVICIVFVFTKVEYYKQRKYNYGLQKGVSKI